MLVLRRGLSLGKINSSSYSTVKYGSKSIKSNCVRSWNTFLLDSKDFFLESTFSKKNEFILELSPAALKLFTSNFFINSYYQLHSPNHNAQLYSHFVSVTVCILYCVVLPCLEPVCPALLYLLYVCTLSLCSFDSSSCHVCTHSVRTGQDCLVIVLSIPTSSSVKAWISELHFYVSALVS